MILVECVTEHRDDIGWTQVITVWGNFFYYILLAGSIFERLLSRMFRRGVMLLIVQFVNCT
jgi:hypothetical protein